jgi:hypothetical protein
MAGSIKSFIYTTDTGMTFGVHMDEDWGEIVNNTDVTTDPSGLYGMPKNVTPREARYRASSGTRQLGIIVCDPTTTSDDLPQTITISATNGEPSEVAGENTLTLTSFKGEVFTPIRAIDTGLIDGDAT